MKRDEAWSDLEAKIAQVTEELEVLRKQNRKLSSRVKRLQRETADKPAREAWDGEKKKLRDLAQRLVDTLESLL